ncbi:hypothetical protein [Hyphomonas pacifica]|uniref:hypothetical protein n=1 Tax=Hyphomonas pacifica TaxID=1280941 RepID=UPI000DBFBFAC|nr:hypothetical protein [Hyphomonas pacifica]RAN37353.1 hypothetical protein HY11_09670 [Hyphomonas pacifica]
MLHPSTKRLIDKLSQMTHKQKVAWQEGENGQITHDTEGYRVTLTPEPCAVLLTDALGREIETCSPDDFANEVDANGRPYAQFVTELYLEARRHARGAEKAINALLAGLDEVDAEADVDEASTQEQDASSAIAAGSSTETLIEDLGDDSAPLDPDMYPEFEGQSDMQRAVASLADQVNGQPRAAPVEEAAVEPEEDAELHGFAIPPTEDVEATETEDAHTPLDEPEAGYTPTHMDGAEEVQSGEAGEPEMAEAALDVETEVQIEDAPAEPEPAPYAPAFMDEETAAPIYAQSEPIGDFTPQTETAPQTAPEVETVSRFSEETVDTFEAPSSEDLHVQETPEHSVYTEDLPEESGAEEASPVPSETLEDKPFQTGSFGTGSLNQYRPSHTPEDPAPLIETEEASSAPAPATEDTVETVAAAEATESQPAPQPEAPRSFSLSGISSGFGLGAHSRPAEPAPHPHSPDPVEKVGSPHVVIDGTSDLPDWLPEQSESDIHADDQPPSTDAPSTDDNEEVVATQTQEETPEVQPEANNWETSAPAPDYSPFPEAETPPTPREAPSETYTPYESETFEEDEDTEPTPPSRPAKRFNPWN